MSATWSGTIVLDEPREAVWDFLTSEANDVNWRAPWLRSVRKVSGGPFGIGVRYESVYRFFGREQVVVTELTEIDAPRRLAWRQVGHGTLAINDGSYDLETADGGLTRFTVTGIYASRGPARLLDGAFASYLNHASRQQLAQLAAALGQANGGG